MAGVPYPQHGEMDITLANVVNDMTISTSFTIAQYTVTVIRHNGGQIVPYGTIDPVSQNGSNRNKFRNDKGLYNHRRCGFSI